MRRALASLAALGLALPLAASEGAAWLKIPQGARSVAMGTAVSSLQKGAEAQWYTPAALGLSDPFELSLSRQAWLGKTRDDLLAFSLAVPGGGVGGYVNWLGNEDVYRDANGVEGGSFSNSAWAGGLGWGLRLGFLTAGVAGKVIQERYESHQYAGYASDWGLQARMGWLRVGGAVQNLGAWSGQSGSGSVDLPLTYRGGAALVGAVPGLSLSLEGRSLPRSQEASALAGAEFAFHSGLWGGALRAGYEAANADLGNGAGLSLGAGLTLGGLSVDFAYSPYGGLGTPYRMSLAWAAAAPAPPPPKPLDPLGAAPESGAGAQPTRGLEARLDEAARALTAHDFTRAGQLYGDLAAEYPANARPFDGLFRVYYAQGRKAEAIQALREKLAREPDEAQRRWLQQYEYQ